MESKDTAEEWQPIIDYEKLSYETYIVCAKLCKDIYIFNSIMGDNSYDGRRIALNLYKYAVTLLYQNIKDIYGENSVDFFYNELVIVKAFSFMMLCSNEELLDILHDSVESKPETWSSDLVKLHGSLDAKERIAEIDELISKGATAIKEFENLPS